MTREEAIEWVKTAMIDFARDDERSDEILTARDMAISALEQEPCETSTDEPMTMVYPTIFCDDAISREDAIAEIYDKYMTVDGGLHNNTANGCIEVIKKLTPVQPSRKGHWIRWREDFDYIERGVTESIPHCQCSECKKEYDPHTAQFINFCPNCGADMMGDTDDKTM